MCDRAKSRRLGAPGRIAALVGIALMASGCGSEAGELQETEEPRDLAIFVYDRSGSVSDYQLGLAQELTSGRVRRLGHGDVIVAMEILEASLEEPPHRWAQQVPEREYPGREVGSDATARDRFLRDAVTYMRRFTEIEGREPTRGTDILSTLHDVAADLRAHADHRATLYLFSDMLQANPSMNFERPGSTPPVRWIERSAEDGQLPDLEGLCVVVVGARVDTQHGQAVKEFWQRYFDETGAELRNQNYMLRPVELPDSPCGR